jgi:transcriptional regulator with XRE-family HTH domain
MSTASMSKIRELRLKQNLTQQQFASLLRTDQSLVSKWETGRHKPVQSTKAKIAQVLKVEVSELL